SWKRADPEQRTADSAGGQYPPLAVDTEVEGRYGRPQHYQAEEAGCSRSEVGKGPILNNAQLTVQAVNIHLSPSTQKLKADTDVRSIIKPKKPAAPDLKLEKGRS